MKENCNPKNSINTYKYYINLNANTIIKILKTFQYTINRQIINNNNQVVGLNIISEGKEFYLPCKPSGFIKNMEIQFVSDTLNYQSYSDTFRFLKTIYQISQNRIQSNPVKKIVDKQHVVGIITSSNQFVPIIPERYEKRLPDDEDIEVENTYNIDNQLLLDDKLLKTKKTDIEIKLIVRKLTLENSFYNIFRNTFKIIINFKKIYKLNNN